MALSKACKSAAETTPSFATKRDLSTARIWSTTATEFLPALGIARTIGGATSGEELNGTTTGVERI